MKKILLLSILILGAFTAKAQFSFHSLFIEHWNKANYLYEITPPQTDEVLLEVNLFPNPATSVINIELSAPAEDGLVELFDVNGELATSLTLIQGSDRHLLFVADLPRGDYILKGTINKYDFEEAIEIR